jgi:asparagine synthase (glutamine-hydrolysing)
MSGIIGFASNKPIKKKSLLSLGANALIHRGSDDSGEWWSKEGNVGLAHKRLSILDLSENGHQPMMDYHSYYDIEVIKFFHLASRGKK